MKITCKKTLKKKLKEAKSICWECAQDNGATMDSGACNTFWHDECDICIKKRSCCAVTDWKWPKEVGVSYVWD